MADETPHQAPVTTAPTKKERDTVILRDVNSECTEEQIKELFDKFNLTPKIKEIRKDIGHTWFISFNETTENDLVDCLLNLRNEKLCDESVKARLKSTELSAELKESSQYKVLPMNSSSRSSPRFYNNSKSSSSYNNKNAQNGRFNSKNLKQQQRDSNKEKMVKPVVLAPPPSMKCANNFPTLSGDAVSTTTEVSNRPPAAVLSEEEENKENTETTPNTTTTPRSPTSVDDVFVTGGGYAAALRKQAPPPPKAEPESKEKQVDKKTKKNNEVSTSNY